MTEHRLERIEREVGAVSGRAYFICRCGVLGPDHPFAGSASQLCAEDFCRHDHKLHSEGKPVTRGPEGQRLPGAPYKAPDEER